VAVSKILVLVLRIRDLAACLPPRISARGVIVGLLANTLLVAFLVLLIVPRVLEKTIPLLMGHIILGTMVVWLFGRVYFLEMLCEELRKDKSGEKQQERE